MIYVVFLMSIFTSGLAALTMSRTAPSIKPDAHVYFVDRPGDKVPFQASRLLTPWKAFARTHFLEVFYDAKGRPAVSHRWEGGRRVETTYLAYTAMGDLLSRTVKDVSGGVRVFKYRV